VESATPVLAVNVLTVAAFGTPVTVSVSVAMEFKTFKLPLMLPPVRGRHLSEVRPRG